MRSGFGVVVWCVGAVLAAAQAPIQPVPPAPRVVHVIVALCDNKYQGIVPVAPVLGNGDDPVRNFYGALRLFATES